jgi:hypothetical protein
MSLASWKAEFYAIEAKDCPAEQAIEHSLTKWRGLRPDVLRLHGLRKRGCVLSDADGRLALHSEQCALCAVNPSCETCALSQVRNGVDCSTTLAQGEDESPWEAWTEYGDAEPMIALIEAAKARAALSKAGATHD